ncbi:MAG: cell division protein FtsQ/DivIB [Clostridium sp.]
MGTNTNKYIIKAKRKKKIRKTIFLLTLTGIVLVGVAYKSSLFNIKKFQVVGEKNLTEEKILDLVNGLEGENIFLINSKEVENALKAIPYVEEVKVKKKYPNTLVLDVNQQNASYYINRGDEFLILSDDLHLIDKEFDLTIPNIMELHGVNIEAQEVGKRINEIDERTKQVVEMFYKINSLEKVTKKITSLDITNLNEIKVNIDEVQCLLGSDENILDKMEFVFDALSEKNTVITKGYIDIRSLGAPIIKTEE